MNIIFQKISKNQESISLIIIILRKNKLPKLKKNEKFKTISYQVKKVLTKLI